MKLIKDINRIEYKVTDRYMYELKNPKRSKTAWRRRITRADVRKAVKNSSFAVGCSYSSSHATLLTMFLVSDMGKMFQIGCRRFRGAAAKALHEWAK